MTESRAGRAAAGGFTLVEILVALLVLGLLVAGLGRGLRFGLQAWDRAMAIAGEGDALDALDRVLRGLVAQAHPGRPGQPAPFRLLPGGLGFVTRLPDQPEQPGQPVEALLLLDARQRLVLRTRPWRHAIARNPAPFAETELLRGVAGFELAFWEAGQGWSGRWEAPNLPALLRLRLRLAAGHWPDIVVAPGLDRP